MPILSYRHGGISRDQSGEWYHVHLTMHSEVVRHPTSSMTTTVARWPLAERGILLVSTGSARLQHYTGFNQIGGLWLTFNRALRDTAFIIDGTNCGSVFNVRLSSATPLKHWHATLRFAFDTVPYGKHRMNGMQNLRH
jgi:hypothetical protein